ANAQPATAREPPDASATSTASPRGRRRALITQTPRQEPTGHAEAGRQRADHAHRPRDADGQLDARVLGAGHALVGAAPAGLRSAARAAPRRAVDRLPRLSWQARSGPEPLSASRRLPV